MTTERAARKLARSALLVIFAAQAALTVAIFIAHNMGSFGGGVAIYASSLALPGAPVAARIGLFDATRRSASRYHSLRVAIGGADAQVTPNDGFEIVKGDASGDGDSSEIVVQIEADTLDAPVAVTATQRLAVGRGWIDDPRTFTQPASARGPLPNELVGADITFRTKPVTDACPATLWIAAAGGVVTGGLPTTVWLRVTDPAGAPVPGLTLTVTGPASMRTAGTTDALGVTRLRPVVDLPGDWNVAFACPSDGTPVERLIDVAPTRDGITLSPLDPLIAPAQPVAFEVAHQRGWGEANADLWCDGAWVDTRTDPIRGGQVGLVFRALPAAAQPRLCVGQVYTYLLSPDPPRSVHYVIVRGVGQTKREALLALVDTARRSGAPLAGSLDPSTVRAIDGADEATLDRFAGWLLNTLPPQFYPSPLLLDDAPRARSVHDAAARETERRLTTALLADALVIVLGVVAVVVPRARRQSRDMLAALEEDAELADESERQAAGTNLAAWVGIAAGLFAIIASIVGIAVLLQVMTPTP